MALGAALGLFIVTAATGGGEDSDAPRTIIGDVSTTLSPPSETIAPTSATTEATTPATTRVTLAPTTPATQSTAAPTTGARAVSYANCAAVRSAGAAPLLRGQPGYTSGSSGLDRDNDGIACE